MSTIIARFPLLMDTTQTSTENNAQVVKISTTHWKEKKKHSLTKFMYSVFWVPVTDHSKNSQHFTVWNQKKKNHTQTHYVQNLNECHSDTFFWCGSILVNQQNGEMASGLVLSLLENWRHRVMPSRCVGFSELDHTIPMCELTVSG